MKGSLKIFMAFSEVAPFIKTGGLGDVGGALPKALKQMGHDVRVITPQYRAVNERRYILRDVIRLQDILIQMGNNEIQLNVKSAFLPGSKVQVYFTDYRPYFFREGLYVDPKTHKDYSDNAERFILFNKAVLETLKKLQWQPDVIHCNDWQTALVPFLLKTHYKDDPFFKGVRTLLTVHNFAFQGIYNPKVIDMLNLDSSFKFKGSVLEWYDQFSFLKAGLSSTDFVNTVSPQHAKEVMGSGDYGCGMEKVLKKSKQKLHGILNGIDDQVWDPEHDKMIPEKYSVEDISGKQICKEELLKAHGITDTGDDTAVVSMITRLTQQKGLDLLLEAFNDIVKLPVMLFVLGVGDTKYHSFLQKLSKKHARQLHVTLDFDDGLAHRILAGSDIFLMPSLFEPCGLTQLYAMKYGAVPLVYKTGGLADTVSPVNKLKKMGTGFVMEKPDAETLLSELNEALALFQDKEKWAQIVRNDMEQDFSWMRSAEGYIQLYYDCMKSA